MKKILSLILLVLILLTSCREKLTEIELTISSPEFNYESGIYENIIIVSMSNQTKGSLIRYTTDGKDPDLTSQYYSEPIEINKPINLKAKSFKTGWKSSTVTSATYTFIAGKPEFSINGGSFNDSQTVSISSKTENTKIYYTLDGSVPDEGAFLYLSPLTLTQSATLKARAFRIDWADSEIHSAEYIFALNDLIFTPAPAIYTSPQYVSIHFTDKNEMATIHYTLDGTEPTQQSAVYSEPVLIDTDKTLSALALKTNWENSTVTSGEYIITGTVFTPVFNLPGATYTSAQNISISCSTPGATIRFTTDGSEPDNSSEIYSTPVNITESTILKAKAFKTDWEDSATTISEYIITGTVPMPVFDPPGGTYYSTIEVSIFIPEFFSDNKFKSLDSAKRRVREDIEIRYTTNGSAPNAYSELYRTPLIVPASTVIRARAFRKDWLDSEIADGVYSFVFPLEMVFIQGGGFSPDNELYNVSLSSFYMSKYEVTQAEWTSVMTGNNNNIPTRAVVLAHNPNFPMHTVSWYDVLVFCNRRSVQEGLTPVYLKGGDSNTNNWGRVPSIEAGDPVRPEWDSIVMDMNANGYKLPTEMQWEWAARGGVPAQQAGTFNTTYSGSDNINDVAWYNENSGNLIFTVGIKAPNEIGLYDMSGNISEWVWDWYETSYPTGAETNPTGPDSGLNRAVRGGHSRISASECTVSIRSFIFHPGYRSIAQGFRCVRNAD